MRSRGTKLRRMALTQMLQHWFDDELHRNTLLTTTPFAFSLLLLLLVFSPLFLLKKFGKGSTKVLNLPPSPPKLPIIGHLHLLGTLPHRSLQALAAKHGPVLLLQLGRVPTLLLTSLDAAKDIMKTHDAVFANRSQTWASTMIFYGNTDVGFSPYGEYWKQVRKLGVNEFWSPKRVHSFQSVREEAVTELIEKTIRKTCLDGASIHIGGLMLEVSSTIITRCVLGHKCGGDKDSMRRYGELSKASMMLMGDFWFRDTFRFVGWLDVLTGITKRMRETYRGLDDFLNQVIKDHSSSKSDQPADKECFIQTILRLHKEGTLGINLTLDNVKALLQDMFIGGIDTVSALVEWTMAELVKHPTIMKKAQEEIRRVVGKKSKVDEADIEKMAYLKSIIKESLRLHPPSPFLIPRVSSVGTKLGGYDVPPRTRVYINVWAIQRDPKLWDRAEEFLPERFLNSAVDFKGQHFQFTPFGAGRRMCPGYLFGVTEAEHVLANLLCWFNWELPGGASGEDLDMSEQHGQVVHRKVPLHLVPLSRSP